jgi:prevent-host-death family protein
VSLGQWLDRVAAGADVIVTRRGKPMVRLTSAAPAPEPLAALPAPQRLVPPAGGVESG